MKTKILLTILFAGLLGSAAAQQTLHSHWEELTASDWTKALVQSDSTCILPIGILEKHGPHAPMGTDLIRACTYAEKAVKTEYAVIFPEYFYGQINEAKHQPGAFALPAHITFELLEATCDEIARNGFKKIIIVNGHGGNPELLHYFMQTRLEKRRDYAVFLYQPNTPDPGYEQSFKSLTKTGDLAKGDHAGEMETSEILYDRPDLVQLDRAKDQSGENQNRLNLPDLYTPIWWYAAYPNHYQGDGSKATMALGKLEVEHVSASLARAIKTVKQDKQTLKLQQEFFDKVKEQQ